jgi:hypothetical protein
MLGACSFGQLVACVHFSLSLNFFASHWLILVLYNYGAGVSAFLPMTCFDGCGAHRCRCSGGGRTCDLPGIQCNPSVRRQGWPRATNHPQQGLNKC